jgi:hypothetical protein
VLSLRWLSNEAKKSRKRAFTALRRELSSLPVLSPIQVNANTLKAVPWFHGVWREMRADAVAPPRQNIRALFKRDKS